MIHKNDVHGYVIHLQYQKIDIYCEIVINYKLVSETLFSSLFHHSVLVNLSVSMMMH